MLLDLAVQNLVSPPTLFFLLGLGSAVVRSDLAVPEPVAKLLVMYLLISIGFRGGAELAHHGLDLQLLKAMAVGVALSFGIPFIAYAALRRLMALPSVDAAAIAGHYGSISAVTFAAITAALIQVGLTQEGFMVAVAAVMEAPAIFAALILAKRSVKTGTSGQTGKLFRHVAFNGSIMVLAGAFVIGALVGPRGLATVKPFFIDLFPGFLCLFLLEMGLIAGQGLRRDGRILTPGLLVFAVAMPLFNGALAGGLAVLIGLSAGGTAVLITLAASASYIAVPAALRLALPEANIAQALSLSLCVTFPFNLVIGVPAYIAVATMIAR